MAHIENFWINAAITNPDNRKNCCGCTACVSICAHDAIKMKPDALGFLYPEVDKDKCVDCGLCEKVCPLKNDSKKSGDQSIYGLRNKDEHIVQESTSGGGFFAIARFVVEQGGIVYGADRRCRECD